MSEQWHVEENVRPGGSYNICHGTRAVALYATLEDAEQIVRDHNAAQAGDEGTARLRAIEQAARAFLDETSFEYQDHQEDRTPSPVCMGCGASGFGDLKHESECPAERLRTALAHEPAAAGDPTA